MALDQHAQDGNSGDESSLQGRTTSSGYECNGDRSNVLTAAADSGSTFLGHNIDQFSSNELRFLTRHSNLAKELHSLRSSEAALRVDNRLLLESTRRLHAQWLEMAADAHALRIELANADERLQELESQLRWKSAVRANSSERVETRSVSACDENQQESWKFSPNASTPPERHLDTSALSSCARVRGGVAAAQATPQEQVGEQGAAGRVAQVAHAVPEAFGEVAHEAGAAQASIAQPEHTPCTTHAFDDARAFQLEGALAAMHATHAFEAISARLGVNHPQKQAGEALSPPPPPPPPYSATVPLAPPQLDPPMCAFGRPSAVHPTHTQHAAQLAPPSLLDFALAADTQCGVSGISAFASGEDLCPACVSPQRQPLPAAAAADTATRDHATTGAAAAKTPCRTQTAADARLASCAAAAHGDAKGLDSFELLSQQLLREWRSDAIGDGRARGASDGASADTSPRSAHRCACAESCSQADCTPRVRAAAARACASAPLTACASVASPQAPSPFIDKWKVPNGINAGALASSLWWRLEDDEQRQWLLRQLGRLTASSNTERSRRTEVAVALRSVTLTPILSRTPPAPWAWQEQLSLSLDGAHTWASSYTSSLSSVGTVSSLRKSRLSAQSDQPLHASGRNKSARSVSGRSVSSETGRTTTLQPPPVLPTDRLPAQTLQGAAASVVVMSHSRHGGASETSTSVTR